MCKKVDVFWKVPIPEANEEWNDEDEARREILRWFEEFCLFEHTKEFGVATIKLEFGFDQDERSSDRTTRWELSGGRRCVGWTID